MCILFIYVISISISCSYVPNKWVKINGVGDFLLNLINRGVKINGGGVGLEL